jgi:hypothetical protein
MRLSLLTDIDGASGQVRCISRTYIHICIAWLKDTSLVTPCFVCSWVEMIW